MIEENPRDCWETPWDLVRGIERLIVRHDFTLDAASTQENKKAPHRCLDGLNDYWGGVVFCNPPYSDIDTWVKVARERYHLCQEQCLLLPNWTDRQWFGGVDSGYDVTFLTGRVQFVHKGVNVSGNPHGSMLLTKGVGRVSTIPTKILLEEGSKCIHSCP